MSVAQKLHQETLEAVKVLQTQEKRIIDLLIENYETGAYRQLGFANLHTYCTIGLGLSDSVAWSLSTIAKKVTSNPEIKTLIDEDKMTITNATQISRVITSENKENLLELGQTLSKRELEREIKGINPEAIPKERVRDNLHTFCSFHHSFIHKMHS